MLIKRLMLTAMLVTMTNSIFCADINYLASIYGVQSNQISTESMMTLLELSRLVDSWENLEYMPLSSIIRAQLSEDTTSSRLGTTETFAILFPSNRDEIAAAFKQLVAAESTHTSRNAAINKIRGLSAVADAVAAPVIEFVGGYATSSDDERVVAKALQPGQPLYEMFNSHKPGILTGNDLASDIKVNSDGFDLPAAYYFNTLNGLNQTEVKNAFNRLAQSLGARAIDA